MYGMGRIKKNNNNNNNNTGRLYNYCRLNQRSFVFLFFYFYFLTHHYFLGMRKGERGRGHTKGGKKMYIKILSRW